MSIDYKSELDELRSEISSGSQGSEDVSQDKDAVEAGTSEGAADASEDASGNEQDTWLVPGRFKDANSVLESYKHIEAEYSRTQNELKQLKNAQLNKPVDPKERNQKFLSDLQKDPYGAIESVAEAKAKAIEFKNEYNRLMGYEEFRSLEPVMLQLSDQYSDLIRQNEMQNDPRLLEVLYYAAKGVKSQTEIQQAAQQGKAAGEASALKKKKVSLEGTSGSKGKSTTPFREKSLEEMRKELGVAERF